ncbi:PKD domain-containing protein [bacterium]|nr:PKD domain-containing protein [bacterium]
MRYRFLFLSLLIASISAFSPAAAQLQRNRIFIEGQLRNSAYTGDRRDGGIFDIPDLLSSSGPSGSIGLGYQVWDSVDLVGELSVSTYYGITNTKLGFSFIDPSESSIRHKAISGTARIRMLRFGSFQPFLIGGFAITVGNINSKRTTGYGPVAGMGIGRQFGRIHVFATAVQHYVFPNQAVDLAGVGRSPDVLSSLNFGLQYRFRKKDPKINQVRISGPHTLDQNAEGVFQAATDLDPIEYSVRWDFGDGTSSTGHSVRHAYREEGSYVVSAFISNERGSSTSSLPVTVVAVYDRVSLLSMTVTPGSVYPEMPVTFSPVLRGNDIACSWDFGDGSTASDCETNHIYYQPGKYKVTFSASNPSHSAHSTQTVTVLADACNELPDLTAVFFQARSSELSLEMRQILRDNLATAGACTERVIRIVGYALDNERRPLELAGDRAAGVFQYYRNLGIPANRIQVAQPVIRKSATIDGLPWSHRSVTSALVKAGL